MNIRSSKTEYSASPCVQLNRFIRWWQRYRYGEDAQPLPVHQSQSYSSITTTTNVNPVTNIWCPDHTFFGAFRLLFLWEVEKLHCSLPLPILFALVILRLHIFHDLLHNENLLRFGFKLLPMPLYKTFISCSCSEFFNEKTYFSSNFSYFFKQ